MEFPHIKIRTHHIKKGGCQEKYLPDKYFLYLNCG